MYPIALQKYFVFGAEVISPCEGVVVAATDHLPDLLPPDRDVEHAAGNHVAIDTGDCTVYLAHLMKGSVTVDVGQRVRAGKILGKVGNSGDTTEPHLHVHAERDSEGIPLRFKGRFLVRNDCVDVRD